MPTYLTKKGETGTFSNKINSSFRTYLTPLLQPGSNYEHKVLGRPQIAEDRRWTSLLASSILWQQPSHSSRQSDYWHEDGGGMIAYKVRNAAEKVKERFSGLLPPLRRVASATWGPSTAAELSCVQQNEEREEERGKRGERLENRHLFLLVPQARREQKSGTGVWIIIFLLNWAFAPTNGE